MNHCVFISCREALSGSSSDDLAACDGSLPLPIQVSTHNDGLRFHVKHLVE